MWQLFLGPGIITCTPNVFVGNFFLWLTLLQTFHRHPVFKPQKYTYSSIRCFTSLQKLLNFLHYKSFSAYDTYKEMKRF